MTNCPMKRCLATLVEATLLAVAATGVSARELVVSPDGDDVAAGTQARPFRTIQRAADAMQPGDTCVIEPGVYRETVTLKTSGRVGAPLRFTARKPQTVTLSGTEIITSEWRRHRGEVWKTQTKRRVGQLFVDGEVMVEARWPNQPFDRRWDKSTWRPAQEGSEYGKLVDDAVAQTDIDWTGGLGVLNVGSWETYLRPIQSHAAGAGAFQYPTDLSKRHESAKTQRKRTWPGFDHYFLMGKLEALDTPGEWFFDRDTGTLYLWPPTGKTPDTCHIEGKTRGYGFVVQGKTHVELSGLSFFATTFMFEGVEDCLVEDCALRFPTYVVPVACRGADAPVLSKRTRLFATRFLGGPRVLAPTMIDGTRCTIRNCRVSFSEAPGLLVKGTDNTVENCLVHDIDWRGLGNGCIYNSAGIHLGMSARSTLKRCTVYNVGSSEGVVLPTVGPSLCELNYVHHGGLVQSDGALIQCHGIKLNGTIIRYNWTHDHHAFRWGGIGIRGDDLSRNLLVHHNVAWNCPEKGIMIKGDYNRAFHNSCFDNPIFDLVLWATPEPFKEWAPRQHAHLVEVQNQHSEARNNYAPVISGQMPHELGSARKVTLPAAQLSHNFEPGVTMLLDAWPPLFRDDQPMLEDPGGHDFRPRQGSPLIDAGTTVPNITAGALGKAPDVGAYERGADNYWIPGYQSPAASHPIPADGARRPAVGAVLTWLPGRRADVVDVYVGESRDAVAAATRNSGEYRGKQANNTFTPAPLHPGRTVFWRIDSLAPTGTVAGPVWEFAVTANTPPRFKTATGLPREPALAGVPYRESIAAEAVDPDPGDWLTFTKADGPDWISVTASGIVHGTPTDADLGTRRIAIEAKDRQAAVAARHFSIDVAEPELYVVNGSFETPAIASMTEKNYHGGPAKGWDGGKWRPSLQTRDVEARSGAQAAFCNDPKDVTFGQTVLARAEAGVTYTLRYHVRASSGHSGDCRVTARLLVADVVAAQDTVTHKAIPQDTWTEREAAYTARPDDAGKPLRVEFNVNDLSPDAYTRFMLDDVSLTPKRR